MEPVKFDPTSHTLTDDLKAQLKALVPEVFTENAIDFDRLKTLLGELVEQGQERYSFTWPGKTQAIRAAQTPSIGTLVPDKDSSENWDTTQNLYLEGDNLEILKLLQKSYTGKVKMIYIDPPYNTGKDFVYPDNYGEGLKTYLEYTGQVDGDGKKITTNAETDGRYHSKWLNMMYPRLMLARNLLKDDGVIFISIDDHEQANLKKICDEVFGAENLIIQICHKSRASVSNDKIISPNHNFILLYAKKLEDVFENRANFGIAPDLEGFDEVDERGQYKLVPVDGPGGAKKGNPHYTFQGITGYWRFSLLKMQEKFEQGLVVVRGNGLLQKYYLNDAKKTRKTITSWWDQKFYTSTATTRLSDLMGGNYFDTPKPVELIKLMLDVSSREHGDIIIDFFSGSGTTAHAVMELNAEDGINRKFIMTQLQESTPEDSEARKAGYQNIADLGRERVKRAGARVKAEFTDKLAERETPFDIGFRTYRLAPSTFNTWDATSADDIQAKLLGATSLVKAEASTDDVLSELILKSGYGLSGVITATEVHGVKVYSVAGGELVIALEGAVSETAVRAIADMAPKRFIAREDAFPDDASLTNAAQIMKDKGIDFRVL